MSAANGFQVRLPNDLHPHTIEVPIPYSAERSNWIIRCQEQKSGAARGCSPRWYGFKPADFVLARQIAAAPRLVEALRKIVDGWNSVDQDAQVPDEINDGRIEAAEALLREIEGAAP